MSTSTYSAKDVDPILDGLRTELEGALTLARNATRDKEAALQELQAEKGRKIELQKVASTAVNKPIVAPDAVNELVDTLIDMAVIRPEGREKVASDLTNDTSNALRHLARALTLSADAPQVGSGIPKQASENGSGNLPPGDPDGWGNCISKGA